MANYSYIAVDAHGSEIRGLLEVATQTEAVRRVREMGLFPTKIKPSAGAQFRGAVPRTGLRAVGTKMHRGFTGRVKAAKLVVFTRQLATMLEAGMPLVRGLRILEEQAESGGLRSITREVSAAIENGSSLSEALASYPRVFNSLYVQLVKAGEAGGALEACLGRLADFMEKAQKLRGKLIGAMVYPAAVVVVATGVMTVLMAFVVPRFERVFEGLLEGARLPVFTRLVFSLSGLLVQHLPSITLVLFCVLMGFLAALKTRFGRLCFDRLKLRLPLLGPLFQKAAISRFARTLGTLTANGVPILQSLSIVKETAGNLIVGGVIARVHEQVKQGDTMAPILKASKVFPPMVAGLVDVGEQTGALPDMLLRVADTYDEEFDNAARGLTSLLEPILIVLLAVIVGSIVIAMFLPLIVLSGGLEGRAQP